MQAPPPDVAQREAMPYLLVAGMSDVYEVTSSQVALMRSRNPRVRAFATMLIDHHSRTTNLTLAAARAGGVAPPPPVLDGEHQQKITQLMAVPAADFDRAFLAQQVPAHEQALMLQQGYASGGDTPQLRTTAQGAIPIIQGHMEEARRMQSGMR